MGFSRRVLGDLPERIWALKGRKRRVFGELPEWIWGRWAFVDLKAAKVPLISPAPVLGSPKALTIGASAIHRPGPVPQSLSTMQAWIDRRFALAVVVHILAIRRFPVHSLKTV